MAEFARKLSREVTELRRMGKKMEENDMVVKFLCAARAKADPIP